ncbi:hypothetical protein BDA99DRAFT_50090 [Phascolomyces articulosus]|uniref:Uncharacterized protein n=1 Tax=Phascolomyces articulosus TaxID=60185 RepID=A0AAD5K0Z5_9FUNG|nr:hypothetical protein BDA99DRAFT_50090 [Phascolomyces articulosus]
MLGTYHRFCLCFFFFINVPIGSVIVEIMLLKYHVSKDRRVSSTFAGLDMCFLIVGSSLPFIQERV